MIEGRGSADFGDRAPDGVRPARSAARGSSSVNAQAVAAYLNEQIAARRRRGDDLRHLGRVAVDAPRTARFRSRRCAPCSRACARRRTGAGCRRSCSPRAAGSGSTRSPHAARRRSGSTGPPISRRRGARVGRPRRAAGQSRSAGPAHRSRHRARARPPPSFARRAHRPATFSTSDTASSRRRRRRMSARSWRRFMASHARAAPLLDLRVVSLGNTRQTRASAAFAGY